MGTCKSAVPIQDIAAQPESQSERLDILKEEFNQSMAVILNLNDTVLKLQDQIETLKAVLEKKNAESTQAPREMDQIHKDEGLSPQVFTFLPCDQLSEKPIQYVSILEEQPQN